MPSLTSPSGQACTFSILKSLYYSSPRASFHCLLKDFSANPGMVLFLPQEFLMQRFNAAFLYL
jgi:hypothetical protein